MSFNILRFGEFCFANSTKLASYNLKNSLTFGAAVQGGIIYWKSQNTDKWTNSHSLTLAITTFNVIALTWNTGKMAQALSEKYQISLMSPNFVKNDWTLSGWSPLKVVGFNLTAVALTTAFTISCALAALVTQSENYSCGTNGSLLLIRGLSLALAIQAVALGLIEGGGVRTLVNIWGYATTFNKPKSISRWENSETKTDYLEKALPKALMALGFIQFGISYAIHQYPGKAGSLYKLQKALLAADFVAIGAKLGTYQFEHGEWSQKWMLLALLLSLGALKMLEITSFNESNDSLLGHLETVLPEKELSLLKINRKSPGIHIFIEWMVINRCIVDLFLSFPDKENRYRYFISAILAALTFGNLLDMNFIHFERKFEMPLQNRSFKLFNKDCLELTGNFKDNLQNTLLETKLELDFIVSGKNLSNEKTLKAIYDYSEAFFDDCHWRYYWRVKTYQGIETGRSIIMDMQVVPRDLLIESTNLANSLISWSNKTVKRWSGTANVHMEFTH